MPIPIYLKTAADMPRPADPEFYLVTQDGTFFCRNHQFFQSDVRTRRPIRSLAPHDVVCRLKYPKLGVAALEYVIGFFDRVFERHASEAVVLLLWDVDRRRYRLLVPEQQATVWESSSGLRSPLDVKYTLPKSLSPQHLLVGDIHSHGDVGPYASWTDKEDELYRDGVHIIVGHIDRDPPSLHMELTVDGTRFPIQFEEIFKGYCQRRRILPEAWMKMMKIKVDRPRHVSYQNSYYRYADAQPARKRWD
jgi:hypothetical protein